MDGPTLAVLVRTAPLHAGVSIHVAREQLAGLGYLHAARLPGRRFGLAHVLHDQAQLVAVAADLEDRDDIGMRKSRDECRLPGEQRLDARLADAAALQTLHGCHASAFTQFRRPGEQHFGYDADSEPPHEVVPTPEVRSLHAGHDLPGT